MQISIHTQNHERSSVANVSHFASLFLSSNSVSSEVPPLSRMRVIYNKAVSFLTQTIVTLGRMLHLYIKDIKEKKVNKIVFNQLKQLRYTLTRLELMNLKSLLVFTHCKSHKYTYKLYA